MISSSQRVLIVLLVGGTLLASAEPAGASVGAGIGASPIELAKPVRPGHDYRLPAAYVVNTGSMPARYHIKIQRLSAGSGRSVPESWVVTGRNDFVLGAHRSALVPLTLKLPSSAPTGTYLSDVVAAAGPTHRQRGTILGAAAATKLTFQIASAASLLPAWVIKALIALASGCVLVLAIRRSPVRIHFDQSTRA